MSRLRISTQDKVRGALKPGLCLKLRLLSKLRATKSLVEEKYTDKQIERRLTEVASELQPLG